MSDQTKAQCARADCDNLVELSKGYFSTPDGACCSMDCSRIVLRYLRLLQELPASSEEISN